MNKAITLFLAILLTSHLTSFANSPINVSATTNTLSRIAPKLNRKVLQIALAAYDKAVVKGLVKKPVLAVIDYSLPSSKQRLWIFER